MTQIVQSRARFLPPALIIIVFLAAWLSSELVMGQFLGCRDNTRRCCSGGRHGADCSSPVSCCTSDFPECGEDGFCRNKNGCQRGEVDCCNVLTILQCFNRPDCPLSCKCCNIRTQYCALVSPLLGLTCLDLPAGIQFKEEL